jgi:hypothetical protein
MGLLNHLPVSQVEELEPPFSYCSSGIEQGAHGAIGQHHSLFEKVEESSRFSTACRSHYPPPPSFALHFIVAAVHKVDNPNYAKATKSIAGTSRAGHLLRLAGSLASEITALGG